MSRTTTLPDSVDDLTALVIEQQNKLDHQSLFIEQLLEQIRLAQHNRFGVKSESILPDQLRLWLDEYGPNEPEAEDAQDDEVKPARPKTKRGRRRLPTHLPRIEINHTLDDEACQCEHCNERMVPLSEKVTEQLDIIPAKVRVLRHHRTTYHCPECKDALKTAPLPPQPIPKSNASPGLLAWLIIAKYLDGMPLYRLERKLKRYGMSLTRSTQAS
jgi:transposase